MPRNITSTYRLQLTREFPISAARKLVPYFHRLGVSHLYLSPVLAARAGSTHGYDVIDHSRLNPELGSDEELRALALDLHEHGMGIVLDIVPNHMAASADNPYWDDVLRRGASRSTASSPPTNRASYFSGRLDEAAIPANHSFGRFGIESSAPLPT